EPGSARQVRLTREVAEIVVESAWSRIGPVHDLVERFQTLALVGGLADLLKPRQKPSAIVQRHIDHVQVRSALGRLAFISRHTQLRADALKQRLSYLEHSRPRPLRHWLR